MTFNSIPFYIFIIIVLLLYYLLSKRFRWTLLLLASCFFYALLDIRYLVLLLVSILIDYASALYIGSEIRTTKKRWALMLSLIMNLSLLLGLKYLELFGSLIVSILSLSGCKLVMPSLHIIVPVGISFFTFKKMSYVIDVYRGSIKPERHFGLFALYVSHFLEILSGPIDRADKLLPQLKNPRPLNMDDFSAGFVLILWGIFLKVVIADRLAIYTDAIFNNVSHHYGPSLVIAAYFYTFQIYCDFAGYTNIAIGCGRLLGVNLMPNFNFPYFAKSISDFWRRWHMSLSSWFRDYLYIPLGGSRVSNMRRCMNYMIVFLLCGLWHGSNWTFMIWGGLHGFYLSIGFLLRDFRMDLIKKLRISGQLHAFIQIVITFNLVAFAWIFFRVGSFEEATIFLNHLVSGWPIPFLDLNSMGYGIIGIIIVICVELFQYRRRLSLDYFVQMPMILRWTCYYALIFAVILFGVDGESSFIYFQF
jgi:alginate O-acetyltransferase complex protein AlgI